MKTETKQLKITVEQIHKLLRKRHAEDVYVSECKTGPSPCPRLDAWAMRKAWIHPCATGYEIKVDRNDFMNDKKWPSYLPFCHEFYFVCPSELISKEEVGSEAGLIWVAKSGNILYTKKKAPYRNVIIPSELYGYLLMARVQVIREQETRSQTEYYRSWFEASEANTILGHEIARKIRRKVDEQVKDVRLLNQKLEHQIEQLEAAKRILQDLGIDTNTYVGTFKKQISAVLNGIPADFELAVYNAHAGLGRFLNHLKDLKKE